MDADSSTSERPKRKFAPRTPPPSRRPTVPPPPTDVDREEKTAQMIASNYAIGRVKPKPERKASSAEVAFQPTSASLPIAPAAVLKDVDKSSDSDLNPSPSADVLATVSSATNPKDGEETIALDDDGDALLVPEEEIDHVEPWDHRNPYSPITLPLRKPPSGSDSELHDMEEFVDGARNPDYDENNLNSAEVLGLTLEEKSSKQKMIFFQLPGPLPVKQQMTESNSEDDTQKRSAFDGLKGGFMGKMCVYKSGVVKWKLGDILFDVSPGPATVFSETVAAINEREEEFANLGSTEKIAVVTPNIDSLLDSEAERDEVEEEKEPRKKT